MSDYVITLRDVYDKVAGLSSRMDSAISSYSVRLASLEARQEMPDRQVSKQTGNTWQAQLAIASGFTGVIISLLTVVMK